MGGEEGSARALPDSRGTSGQRLISDPLLGSTEGRALGKALGTHMETRTSAYEPSSPESMALLQTSGFISASRRGRG